MALLKVVVGKETRMWCWRFNIDWKERESRREQIEVESLTE